MTQGLSIIEKLWAELDTKVAEVTPIGQKWQAAKKDDAGPFENEDQRQLAIVKLEAEKNQLGGVGRGLAMAIQMLTAPAFPDATAVVKHGMARYKALQAGNDLPAMPGKVEGSAASVAAEEPVEKPLGKNTALLSTEQREEAAAQRSERNTSSLREKAQANADAAGPQPPRRRRADTAAKSEPVAEPVSDTAKAKRAEDNTPPTPEQTIDDGVDTTVKSPKTKMSVDEALARAAKRTAEAKANAPEDAPVEPSTGHGEHTPDDIAAMLAGLDD